MSSSKKAGVENISYENNEDHEVGLKYRKTLDRNYVNITLLVFSEYEILL